MSIKTIVFDLDDTLIHEIEFLKSAFKEIANAIDENSQDLFNKMMFWYENNENVFDNLMKLDSNITIESLKSSYRNHFPKFNSNAKIRELLLDFKQNGHILGLITDGFSITQRNKIKALDIENLFDLIIISEEFGSEKPNENNYNSFHKFATDKYFYIGDNTKKDFVTPNKLGWTTICLLDNGQNIHKQNFDLESIYLPKITISSLIELKNYL